MRVVEIDDPWVGRAVRVSIFLSPLDVHVNRSPVAALVEGVQHAAGRFLAAYRDEASELNERCTLALQGEAARVGVKQIAGVLARRIVCRVRQGDKLQAGRALRADPVRLADGPGRAGGYGDQGAGGRQGQGRRDDHGSAAVGVLR